MGEFAAALDAAMDRYADASLLDPDRCLSLNATHFASVASVMHTAAVTS